MKAEPDNRPVICLGRVPIWGCCLAVLFVVASLFTGTASAANQETGGYPWANAPIGSEDDLGGEVRICSSYVTWRLRKEGLSVKRVEFAGNSTVMRENFEVMDETPAAGAAVVFPKASGGRGHIAYVEAVHDDGTMTVSDYNGIGGAYKYGIERTSIPDAALIKKLGIFYVHFELPPVAGGVFLRTAYDDLNGNKLRVSGGTVFESGRYGRYLKSANDRFSLLFRPDGSLAAYDMADGFAMKWRFKLRGSRPVDLELVPGRNRRSKIVLRDKNFRIVRVIPIGLARQVVLSNSGTLVGKRNGKRLWEAKTLNQVEKVVRAAQNRSRRAR